MYQPKEKLEVKNSKHKSSVNNPIGQKLKKLGKKIDHIFEKVCEVEKKIENLACLLYTSPSPRDS